MALGVLSCQKDDLLKPGDLQVNVMTASYVSDEQFRQNPIELNGEVKEAEWGGPLDTDLPYHQVRVSRENGSGDPGEPAYVSMKCVYTDSNIYFLFRWTDGTADDMKDATYYIGPDLLADTTGAYAGCANRQWLATNQVWSRTFNGGRANDEDRLAIAFEMQPAGDEKGSFADQGCLSACHVDRSPAFGTINRGKLDVWQWLATRTNPVRDLFDRREPAGFPLHGVPGYLDDMNAEPLTGLAPDPGTPSWRQNWEGNNSYPTFIYRDADDLPYTSDQCQNEFGEKCIRNNGLPLYYIWRENPARQLLDFACQDSVNQAVLPAGREPRKWQPGDAVSGYWYTYPSLSRADVHGKGLYEPELHRWTLEVGRPLTTQDEVNDIAFSGQPGAEIHFAISVADNSTDVHWGSESHILRFGPKGSTRNKGVQQ